MPGSTPVYGITYPCGGETIDAAAMLEFSESLDAALAQATDELDAVTTRPNAMVRYAVGGTAQTVAVNVITNVTYAAEQYDNDNMADLVANNERLTCRTSGVYHVSSTFSLSNVTTLTGLSIIITVNGVEIGRWKTRVVVGGTFGECTLAIPVNMFAGDILRTQILWTGTGGPGSVTNNSMAASLLCIH